MFFNHLLNFLEQYPASGLQWGESMQVAQELETPNKELHNHENQHDHITHRLTSPSHCITSLRVQVAQYAKFGQLAEGHSAILSIRTPSTT